MLEQENTSENEDISEGAVALGAQEERGNIEIPKTVEPMPQDDLYDDTYDEQAGAEPSPRYTATREAAKEAGEKAGTAAGGALSFIGQKLEGEESPTTEANGDDLSDMFKTPSMDDPDMQTSDLLEVTEEDVMGEGGEDMSDLIEVTEEDVMGDGETDVDDLLAVPGEEDMSSLIIGPDEDDLSDLVDVDREDIAGYPGSPPGGEEAGSLRKLSPSLRKRTSTQGGPRSSPSMGGIRR